jgi:outer membrane protein TolC
MGRRGEGPACRSLRYALATVALLLCACSDQPAKPLPLPTTPAPAPALAQVAASADLARPLDGDALAAIAVLANPDLRALRTREGVAAAQVFAAGLLPDPIITFGLDIPTNGDDVSPALLLGLGIDFAEIARQPANLRGAQAELASVRYDIAWSEWLTAEQARLLGLRVSHLRRIEALTGELRELANEQLAHSLQATGRGDLPAAALEAARLAAADAGDRYRNAQLQLRGAELDLNRLLGIDPGTRVRLAAPPEPPTGLPDDEALYQLAVATRCDLAALRAGYEGSQAAVDVAALERYPLPVLELNAARDTSRIKTLGPAISFSLPLWNRGRGDVAVAAATQAQLRVEYLARLETIRADLAAASANLQVTERQRAELQQELAPLEPQVRSSAGAARRGDLSQAAAAATRANLLDKQVVEAELTLAMAEFGIALEVSVGQPLEDLR